MKLAGVVVACAVVLGGNAARADAVSPEKAAEMLSHAWMIDNRCNVLGNDERDALTTLVARAELSLAEKKSVAAARAAIGKGRASGTAAPCDAESAKMVRDVLRAAQSATAGAPMEAVAEPVQKAPVAAVAAPAVAAVVAPEPDDEAQAAPLIAEVQEDDAPVHTEMVRKKPVSKIVVKSPRSVQQPANVAMAPKKPAPKKIALRKIVIAEPGAAGSYAATAEAYYKELRCRTKSYRAVSAMYSVVLRQHRQAVAAQGKARVKALLRAAEARAARGSC